MTGVESLTGHVNHATLLDRDIGFPRRPSSPATSGWRNAFVYGTDSLTFMQGFDGTGSIFAEDSIVEHGPINFSSLSDEDAEFVGLYANNELILWGG